MNVPVEATIRLGSTELPDFVQHLIDAQASYVAMANAKLTTEAERSNLLRMAAICQSVQAQLEGWTVNLQGRVDWSASNEPPVFTEG